MKNLNSIIALTVALIFMAGCSSPKDASKDNFEKVINAYLEKNCIIVAPRKTSFPVTVDLLPKENKLAEKNNPETTKQYDALVKVGFLEEKDGSREKNQFRLGNVKITVPTKIYSLTKKGEQAFKKITHEGFFGGSNGGFCAAIYKVSEIRNFSEPSQAMGYTISNVNFTIAAHNISDWAKNQGITEAFPRLAKALEANQSQTSILVLMNDGWVHEKEMEK